MAAAPGRPTNQEGADNLPSAETLMSIRALPILDRAGASHAFGDIIEGPDNGPKVLVVFIRHFFCAACQAYIRRLVASATPDALKSKTPSTSIIVIGCGDSGLIDQWRDITGCPWPVYTDPTTAIYAALNFNDTQAGGNLEKGYYTGSVLYSAWTGLTQAFWKPTLIHRGGKPTQNGGELLFEGGSSGEKQLKWLHRMKHATDHTQFPEILEILGVEEKSSEGMVS